MEKLLYHYRVKHPEHGEIQVAAEDRLHAVCQAGKKWGVRWTDIARECACERLGPAPKPETGKRKAQDGRQKSGKGAEKK